MARYAAQTEVSSSKSRDEIERTLARYGAGAFMYAWDDEAGKAMVSFRVRERYYRIKLPLPSREDFRYTPARGTLRSPQAQEQAYEQSVKQRWRALALWIKAVLEAAESGITTLEEALMPFTLLPDERTVGEFMEEQIKQVYLTGKMPPLIPYLQDK